MATSSAGLHENPERLAPGTEDRHRALVSLMEELEAVDWYDQRADAAGDDELREILRHHRDDEKEHASMLLEWIRRHDPAFAHELRTYLGSPDRVREQVEAKRLGYLGSDDGSSGGGDDWVGSNDGSLRLGSLLGVPQ